MKSFSAQGSSTNNKMKNCPLGEQPAQRESTGQAGELPGQDTDMLDATALCGHNRVKSVHMVFIEPQSESQGPSGRGDLPWPQGPLSSPPKRWVCRSLEGPLGAVYGQ